MTRAPTLPPRRAGRRPGLPALCSAMALAASLWAGQGIAQQRDPAPPAVAPDRCAVESAAGEAGAAAGDLEVVEAGDRIKLSFFEVLQQQEDKWGADRSRLQSPARGFQMRPELSGEFLVQQDGTIVLPLFGPFKVAGTRQQALQKALECSFTAVMGRQGMVNVLAVTKRPVYVVGPVKRSGSFEFVPGMTAIQALALAGGVERLPAESAQSTELTREAERLQQTLDRASRNLARAIVLSSEAGVPAPDSAADLAALAGPTATATLADEANARRLGQVARGTQEKALDTAVKTAQAELQARRLRVDGLKSAVALRRERLAAVTKLAASGSASRPMMIQAQAELTDAESRLSETLSAIAQAEERLERSRQDLAQLRLQTSLSLQRDLATARQDARKDLQESEGVAAVIRSLVRSQAQSAASATIDYVIVRRQANAMLSLKATETTPLQPGDVLQIVPGPPPRGPGEPTN